MKINSLYISPLEVGTGTVIISFGLMELLKRKYKTVAFFRPIVESKDCSDINFIHQYFNLKMKRSESVGMSIDEAEELISNKQTHKLFEKLITKYEELKSKYDFVLIQGISKNSVSLTIDFDIDLEVAKNLNTPMIGVLNGKDKSVKQISEDIKIEANNISKEKCLHFATFVNRVDSDKIEKLKKIDFKNNYQINFLPENEKISAITIQDIKDALGAKVLFGNKNTLNKTVSNIKVAAMRFEHALKYIEDRDLIIVPCDRTDVIIGSIAAVHSKTVPNISGIILTGDIKLNGSVKGLIKGFNLKIPILRLKSDTFSVANRVSQVKTDIKAFDKTKTSLIRGLFNSYVDIEAIEKKLNVQSKNIITPVMFEYSLVKKARLNKKTIVLPEPSDERILKATEVLLNLGVVDIILIGNSEKIYHKADLLGLDIKDAQVIDPCSYENFDLMVDKYYDLRCHKGISREYAVDIIQTNPNYFATMMVKMGYADGMVSGSVSTTANTVRPALEIVKTKLDTSIVSSVFFMCMETEVLVFGDCAINPDPDANQLADIAISSAKTARSFGIVPKVAMLSYSTGESGSGADVEKIKEATKIVKEKCNILVDGPIQYDAAVDKNVAKKKLPDSKVAGSANVLVFPDLNTGNNTYKAVQRSSGAVAIGPILQGLNKPINDLSRGCTIADIVNTVAITAIQAAE